MLSNGLSTRRSLSFAENALPPAPPLLEQLPPDATVGEGSAQTSIDPAEFTLSAALAKFPAIPARATMPAGSLPSTSDHVESGPLLDDAVSVLDAHARQTRGTLGRSVAARIAGSLALVHSADMRQELADHLGIDPQPNPS